jgi:ATP-dependent helicase HrpB
VSFFGPFLRSVWPCPVPFEGRVFPLTIEHVEVDESVPLPVRMARAIRRALAEDEGDLLAFLPGVGEILRTQSELSAAARAGNWFLLPLYGDQSADEQDRVFAATRERKVILATNVAETSLTVPGVRIVVDSGLARSASHDPGRGVDRLELVGISRASATQRAGRAGRLGPGRVWRLWSAAADTRRRAHDLPEIRRVDLASAVLELHVWGERDLKQFDWLEAPEPRALERAQRLLVQLGALEPGTLAATSLGNQLARIPSHPRLARLLHEGAAQGALREAALFAALLGERDIVRRSRERAARLSSGPSDLLARADLVHGREHAAGIEVDRSVLRSVERVQQQLEQAARRAFSNLARAERPDEETLLRIILAGFPDRVACLDAPGAREGRMLGGTGVVLSEESVLHDEPLFVVLDADMGQRGEFLRARVRQASAIQREWLADIAGGALRIEDQCVWDAERERVIGRRRTLYEDLVLDEVETSQVDRAQAQRLVLEFAARDPLRALALSDSSERLLARIGALRIWMPELQLPELNAAVLLAALEPWCDGLISLAQLRALPLNDVLLAQLDVRQRAALEQHAPDALTTPAGSNRKLEYTPGKAPVLAVRLQELFGLANTPTVAGGRVPVLLHLLSPNSQVVQVTADLASFWNTTYQQVRKDLRARYPKHSWPEDPWTALPTARAKRRLRPN